MTLQLLICTFADRIHSVAKMLLAPIDGVSYVVSWQHPDGYMPCQLPDALIREDVKVVPLEGKGLSRNRNNALRAASADICLICDDDCSYTKEALKSIIATYEQHPEVDIATFKSIIGSPRPVLPSESFNLKHPVKGYYPISIEMSFLRSAVQGVLQFDEHFGLGSGVFEACEEGVFIRDAIAKGLNCVYFPLTIVEHPAETTSTTRMTDERVLMAQGAYIAIAYPATKHSRAALMAFRLSRKSNASFFSILKNIEKGISKIKDFR